MKLKQGCRLNLLPSEQMTGLRFKVEFTWLIKGEFDRAEFRHRRETATQVEGGGPHQSLDEREVADVRVRLTLVEMERDILKMYGSAAASQMLGQ